VKGPRIQTPRYSIQYVTVSLFFYRKARRMLRNVLANNNDSDHNCVHPILRCWVSPAHSCLSRRTSFWVYGCSQVGCRYRCCPHGTDCQDQGTALRAIVNAWVFVQVVSPTRQSGKIHSLNPTMFRHAVPDLVTNLESNATMASPTPKFIP
jgi:hypothetical protein